MNFYEMRLEFDRIHRSIGDASFEAYRDVWLNAAWEKISEMFVVPPLKRQVSISSVADQNKYLLPYDFNGAEVYLWYDDGTGRKRLDPVEEEVAALCFEDDDEYNDVRFYDYTEPIGSDLAERAECGLTNNSATVTCTTAATADDGHWIRFDPNLDDVDNPLNPGDYGYRITAVEVGVGYTLDRAYRGPDGTYTGRVRPSEQQQLVVYGTPQEAVTDAFTLKYYARPRRLYNNADVPEFPAMGLACVFMAISIGYDYLQDDAGAKVWFGRAASKITNLKNRMKAKDRLVTDLTVGSTTRRTGLPSVRSYK